MKDVTVSEVKFMKRANRGNYEHEEATVTVVPNEENTQSVQEILADLKFEVDNFLSGTSAGVEVSTEDPKQEKPKKTKKAAPKVEKEEEENGEEESNEEEDEIKSKDGEEDEEDEVEEEVVEEEEPAKKTTAGKKTFKKVTPYDRGNDLHKKLIGDMLNKNLKNWKTKASLAKTISQKLHGEPFLDSEGEILPEFQKSYLGKMGK